MSRKRRKFDGKFKSMVALEAVKGNKTLAQLTGEYGVHPNQIVKWKKQLLSGMPEIFNSKKEQKDQDAQHREDQLLRQIGQLTVELEWLKKKSELFS